MADITKLPKMLRDWVPTDAELAATLDLCCSSGDHRNAAERQSAVRYCIMTLNLVARIR